MSVNFDRNLLPKCFRKLEQVKEALYHLRNANYLHEFSDAWSRYLTASGGVIHAVEGGAQISPQGRQWYGGIRRRDRADALCIYFLQARNEEEHGRNAVAGYNPLPGIGVINPETQQLEPFVSWDPDTIEVASDGSMTGRQLRENKGWKIGIGSIPVGPILTSIRDSKFGNIFPPPIEHRGRRISNKSPVYLAEIYCIYLESLVQEAANL